MMLPRCNGMLPPIPRRSKFAAEATRLQPAPAPSKVRPLSEWDRLGPSADSSLPSALVKVNNLKAVGLVPPDLEDLLAVDADLKLGGPSVRAEWCGQLDRDAVLAQLAELLLLAIDRHVSKDLHISNMDVRDPTDRLRSLQPRFTVGLQHGELLTFSVGDQCDQSMVPSSEGSVTGTRKRTHMAASLSISPDRIA
jgi:hypothetical protein